jgi:hypothetical protein
VGLDVSDLLRGVALSQDRGRQRNRTGTGNAERIGGGAELMSRDPLNAGALAFRRSGDPNLGDFGKPTILKAFGEVPNTLDEL